MNPSVRYLEAHAVDDAALVALGLWLFLSLLWPALAQVLGEAISPELAGIDPAAAIAAVRARSSQKSLHHSPLKNP